MVSSSAARGNIDELHFIDPLTRDLDGDDVGRIPAGCSLYVRGWGLLPTTGRPAGSAVGVVDGEVRFSLVAGIGRPDIAQVFGDAELSSCGFHGLYSLVGVPLGPHTIAIELVDPAGERHVVGEPKPFEIVESKTQFPDVPGVGTDRLICALDSITNVDRSADDQPEPATFRRGEVGLIKGWAVDIETRTGASDVYAVVDDEIFLRGLIGRPRHDAAANAGIPEAWRCGFVVRLYTGGLEPGNHRVHVRAISGDRSVFGGSRALPFVVI
jgi:hypothetical protein